MKRILILVATLLLSFGAAQQHATVSGLIQSEDELPEGTRVSIFVVDRDGRWLQEVATTTPVAGTFSVTTAGDAPANLQPFTGGVVPLPGLQTEYRVNAPGEVNYASGRINMYVDLNGSGAFDRDTDPFFLGVPSLESPTGFFVLLYIDADATLSGRGANLELQAGWNIFTVRFPEGGEPQYAVSQSVDDAVLNVFLP